MAQLVISDEKKWNFDGPDGWACYWRDTRVEKRIHVKRHSGGGSVMSWTAFGYHGKCPIVFIRGNMNAVSYVQLLEEYCLPHIQQCAEHPVLYQQDNAPIHTAHVTRDWLDAHFAWHPNWPPYSPDLNPMENMWAIIARQVYPEGKQYEGVDALKQAITAAWAEVTEAIRHNLIDSMPDRMVAVIARDGKAIDV